MFVRVAVAAELVEEECEVVFIRGEIAFVLRLFVMIDSRRVFYDRVVKAFGAALDGTLVAQDKG